jgi:transposase
VTGITSPGCLASDGMGRTARSDKLQSRAEVLPWPRRPASDSPPRSKVAILRLHLLEHVAISDLCDQHGIHPTMFYRWQKEFFENGSAAFEPRSRRPADSKDQRIALLEQKLQRKHEVLSELMEEHIKLKKELGEL